MCSLVTPVLLRYIVLGHSDGSVSAWYTKNKAKMMSAKVSEVRIVAVVCEHLADDGDIYIYVGDSSGRIMTLTRKGWFHFILSLQCYKTFLSIKQVTFWLSQQYPMPLCTRWSKGKSSLSKQFAVVEPLSCLECRLISKHSKHMTPCSS